VPFDIVYLERVADALGTIPSKQRNRIIERVQRLADEEHPRGRKRLKNVEYFGHPVYRLRQGKYRILYATIGHERHVVDIDDRKDVYRK
jgi:mRNA-degrading endonuclease RelE of RelBE toxin-antitoxin system